MMEDGKLGLVDYGAGARMTVEQRTQILAMYINKYDLPFLSVM